MATDGTREPHCPCGGRCHHDTHPCSLGCWAAQKPWRYEPAGGKLIRCLECGAVGEGKLIRCLECGAVGEGELPAAPTDTALRERIAAARFVGEAWIRDILEADALRQTGMSHPVAMVLAALDGETDPRQVGLDPKYHVGFRASIETARAAHPAPAAEPT